MKFDELLQRSFARILLLFTASKVLTTFTKILSIDVNLAELQPWGE